MFRGLPLADDFRVACLHHINHWCFVLLVRPRFARLFRNQRPKLFHVDSRGDVALLKEVKVSHTNLADITRMVPVEMKTVMVLASRILCATV